MNMKAGLTGGLNWYLRMTIALLLVFVLVRLWEYSYIQFTADLGPNWTQFFSSSLNFDSLFVIITSAICLVPFVLIGMLSQKIARILVVVFFAFLVVSNMLFTQYFLTNHALLTGVILDFSISELLHIAGGELDGNRLWMWTGSLLIIALSIFVFIRMRVREQWPKWQMGIGVIYIVALVVAFFNLDHTFKALKHFDNNYDFLLGNSKHVYFIESLRRANPEFDEELVGSAARTYQKALPQRQYSGDEFPFAHVNDQCNELVPFFGSSEKPPNIVIIISESLSSTYAGTSCAIPYALTPRFNELAYHGLTWRSFFSNAERSYGALPNILSSLPPGPGERGFINMDPISEVQTYPEHNSLVSMLEHNGYTTRFFYGGWCDFDNTATYMKGLGVDVFVCDETFDSGKYPRDSGEWGYNDLDLYRQSMDIVSQDTSAPFLSVYQTLSVHSPFDLIDPRYRDEKELSDRLQQVGYVNGNNSGVSDEILAAIFFADDALGQLIDAHKQRPDFDRTIFIVTGDHSIDLNLVTHDFENYHVPLVISSPLIEMHENFGGSCSHIDLLPSLAGLLSGRYGLEIDEQQHWIGQGLDTARAPRYDRMIPLKMQSLEMPNFIYKDHVLIADEIFRLNADFTTSQPDPARADELKQLFRAYQILNEHTCSSDHILPSK